MLSRSELFAHEATDVYKNELLLMEQPIQKVTESYYWNSPFRKLQKVITGTAHSETYRKLFLEQPIQKLTESFNFIQTDYYWLLFVSSLNY